VICNECGYLNEAGASLCANCNAYLGWTQSPAAAPEPAAEAPPGAAPAADPGVEEASAAVTEPIEDPLPAAQGTGPVPPGAPDRPRPAPPPPPPEERPIRPGDLICGQCGAANDPTRTFCRKCANPLVQTPSGATPPQRRPARRPRDLAVVGTRRRPRSTGAMERGARLIRVLALLSLVVIVLLLVGPLRRGAIDLFNRAWPKIQPERPAHVMATSSAPGHGAQGAADLLKSTWWAEGGRGNGEGQRLVLIFDRPYDLARIGITAGAGTTAATYLNQPRPALIRVLFPSGASQDLELRDQPGVFQSFNLEARQVTSLTIQIVSVYPTVDNRHHDCSITEVELFARTCRICRR
jgi:ribosomal protein L40E